MERSETTGALAEALCKVQAGLSSVKREHEAKIETKSGGSYKYSYASLDAVIAACRPALAANGIAVVQMPELERAQDGVPDAVAVTTMLMHTSGEWLRSTLSMPCDLSNAQAVGSAITYGRRYGLQSTVGIAAEEDDDGSSAKSAPRTSGRPQSAASPPKDAPASGPPCGVEGCGGHGVVRSTAAGRQFWGCSNYPPCKGKFPKHEDGQKDLAEEPPSTPADPGADQSLAETEPEPPDEGWDNIEADSREDWLEKIGYRLKLIGATTPTKLKRCLSKWPAGTKLDAPPEKPEDVADLSKLKDLAAWLQSLVDKMPVAAEPAEATKEA